MSGKARRAVFSSIASLLLLLAGCAGRGSLPSGRLEAPARVPGEVYTETGVASWYGDDFHGKVTSNGEIYDMYARTAAHRTLPFGTLVRIENLDNGRSATARVNDRGPFAKSRVIDLTYTLAKELGMVGPGTARVRLTAVGVAEDLPREPRFTIQVGSFAVVENAQNLARSLKSRYPLVRVVEAQVEGRRLHRVRVGLYTSRDDSSSDLRALRRMDLSPLVVMVD